MNLDQLPYIIAIASAGTLSAAAQQLGISQPALSKYLKNVERDVGHSLFYRNGGRYLPTSAGHIYLDTARQILNLYNNSFAAVNALQTRKQTTIRVGVSSNRGIAFLSKIYPEFDRRYPNIQLQPKEGVARRFQEWLQDDIVDLAFSTNIDNLSPGFRTIPVNCEELVLAVPSFHPQVHHTTHIFEELPFAELKNFQNSVFVSPGVHTSLHTMIQKVFRQEGITPEVTVEVPNILIQEAMIRSGTKVGFLPAYYVKPNSELAYFRVKNAPFLTSCCIMREDRQLTEPEEFLVYLFIRNSLESPNSKLIWTDTSRRLVQRYDPLAAVSYGIEVDK